MQIVYAKEELLLRSEAVQAKREFCSLYQSEHIGRWECVAQ